MREAVGAPAPAGRPGRGRRPGARESILDAIRAAEPLSRVELAKITGLTEAAVSMTVRRLLEEGLVVETGRTPTGGKPRTLLQLDPIARLAVGVHLDEDATTYVLTGQTGGVIARLARPASLGDDRDSILRALAADIDTLLAGSGIDPARCLGVGIVWPGPHSGGTPADDTLPHLRGLRGEELGRQLSETTGWPVLVENDATAAAVGEYWVARVGPDQTFAALYMGGGIGAGIVVEGRAMRGGHASAGEFGHLCLEVFGPECWCGSRGCLEILAGPRTVVTAAREDRIAAAEAGLDPAQPSRTVTADFGAIARAARAGAPHCRALLESSARYVAAAAETVVNLLDIDLVVLTGPGFAAASAIYGPAIMRRLAPADAKTWHRNVTVTVSLAAATASATGAAALVLQSHLRA
ncbi:ROK family transcriptional regulator [Actinoplanes regularis]|uniref:Sugar kinase of the NBD/HSP70 family, may contain an N-terminal HTH domain n=1 Tax=Actinoplanes regularis TaxID=52697 RepID=A0A239AB32_9ACTN|nr:ROK family transcriptional regulator [Actinoplanes regularis]GIE86964.1 sugar kinase [Actinoplanes regularis]SNR92749.1 Sugar kinase of the NBD/HSP70 family, may contain an N-terminal HTH domain [Actinoplanes regularis]